MDNELETKRAEKLKEIIVSEVEFYMRHYVFHVEQGIMSANTTVHIEVSVDGMPAPPLRTNISMSDP